jgi:hypothetical protein
MEKKSLAKGVFLFESVLYAVYRLIMIVRRDPLRLTPDRPKEHAQQIA